MWGTNPGNWTPKMIIIYNVIEKPDDDRRWENREWHSTYCGAHRYLCENVNFINQNNWLMDRSLLTASLNVQFNYR